MCGIAGVFCFNDGEADVSLLRSLLAPVRHRGPDDGGGALFHRDGQVTVLSDSDSPFRIPDSRWVQIQGMRSDWVGSGFLLLGHRRLAILDLTAGGHQPMCDPDRKVWLVFNGEIYNYLELREELKNRGHRFMTGCDTEVILASWLEWGRDCFRRFNGMWALVLWDARTQELILSRDRFGEKPLFWTLWSGRLYCVSELKQLKSLKTVEALRPREDAIADYLSMGLTDYDEECFFEGIHQVQPGACLVFRRNGSMENFCYYNLPHAAELPWNPRKKDSLVEEIRSLFEDSVRLRLRSDVPVGTCLSGGLDSSAIAVTAARFLVREGSVGRFQSFSAVFKDSRFDESPFIREIHLWASLEPHFIVLDDKFSWEEIVRLVEVQDQPFISTSIYAQYKVMELAASCGVKVLLDGQGADEIGGGYRPYLNPWLFRVLVHQGVGPFVASLFHVARNNSLSPFDVLRGLLSEMGRLVPYGVFSQVLRMAFASEGIMRPLVIKRSLQRLRGWFSDRGRFDPQTRMRADVAKYNIRSLLRYEDRNSMAFSIETRLPFLDHRLVDRLFAVSADWKFHQGWRKYLFREAFAGILPESVRWRKDKMGFVTTEKGWLRRHADEIRSMFTDRPRSSEWVNPHGFLRAFDAFVRRRADERGVSRFWRFINLELWLRSFLG